MSQIHYCLIRNKFKKNQKTWALKKLTGENHQWTYEEWKERHRQE